MKHSEWLGAAAVGTLLGCGAGGPGASHTPQPSPIALAPVDRAGSLNTSAAADNAATAKQGARPPAPRPAELAEKLRQPEWDVGTDVQVFPLQSAPAEWRVVIVDFETTAKRADGMPVGFRRVALFDPELRVRGQHTIEKSEGGADLLEQEKRDVDGDGRLDWVFYYASRDQWNEPVEGWIAATDAGRLVHVPLSVPLPNDRQLLAEGCWAVIDQVLVQISIWQESVRGGEGPSAVLGHRASAVTIDAGGIKPVSVFGVSVATGADGDALAARIPAAQRMPELDSEVQLPSCAAEPPAFIVVPSGARWALLTGLSLNPGRAGQGWPSSLEKPKAADIVAIPSIDPNTWQTNPARK